MRTHRARIALAILALVPLTALAGEEALWKGGDQRLVAALALSTAPDRTIDRLQDSPASDLEATAEPSMILRTGDVMGVLVFFAGCTNGSNGRCDTDMDLRVLRPDGTPYAELPGGAVWRGLPAPPRKKLQIASANLTLLIEPEDPPGEYRVEVTIRDNRAQTELALSGTFAVVVR